MGGAWVLFICNKEHYYFRMNILEIGIKTLFRGGPSVCPTFSCHFRSVGCANLNRAQASHLH